MSKLFTTKQIQEFLKVDRITVYRMLSDGRLNGIKIGTQWRFPPSEIDRIMGEEKSDEREAAVSIPDFPSNCVKEIQDIFAGIIGIGAITVTLQGTPLTSPTFANPFCKLMLSSESGSEACRASWCSIARKFSGDSKFHTCHAGLSYKRSVIESCKAPAAWLIAGQFFQSAPNEDEQKTRVESLAIKHNIPVMELQEAAKEIPVLKKSQQAQVHTWTPKVAMTFQSILCERADFVNRLQQISELSSVTSTLSQ